MKTTQGDERAGDKRVGQNQMSWSKDAQAQLLRLELSSGSFVLLPYAQLSVVRFDRHGEDDVLTLGFARQEAQVTGKRLRELGLAFQKLAVEWVRESPARYAATAVHGEAVITGIKVIDNQSLAGSMP